MAVQIEINPMLATPALVAFEDTTIKIAGRIKIVYRKSQMKYIVHTITNF